jgi:integrase/recombinase XerD
MTREHCIDIHDYQRGALRAEQAVHRSTLSQRNKELILRYRDVCLQRGVCGSVRLIRVLGALTLGARLLEKDFDTLTREDLERLIAALLRSDPPYSAETLGTYKAILKKFLSWVLAPDEFPDAPPHPMLSWIKCHVRTKDKHRLQRRDLLTPDEAARLITVCRHPRDRAFVSALWESGARIAEIGNRQLKDLTKHEHGFLLDVNGKTGERTPLLVGSAPYLAAWLAYHPFANDPEAPLWVYQHYTAGSKPRHLRYQALRKLLSTLFRRAGITKRPNPHGLRHARATDLAASGRMNESQLKAYLGWTPTSKMPGNYTHLTIQDANNAILAEHGLAPTTECTIALTIKRCPVCQELNVPTATLCARCTQPLDVMAVQEAHQHAQDTTALLLQLCKVLVEKGLLDEAASQIHQAGLGHALKALATRP